MSNKNQVGSGGVSALGLLGILFVALKLIGIEPVASWSWWWVTLPFWGSMVFAILFLVVIWIFIFIIEFIKYIIQ